MICTNRVGSASGLPKTFCEGAIYYPILPVRLFGAEKGCAETGLVQNWNPTKQAALGSKVLGTQPAAELPGQAQPKAVLSPQLLQL